MSDLYTNIDLPDDFKRHIVDSISAGVGDDVKKVLRKENINPKYSNSKGNSVYDYINRNIRRSNDRRFTTEYSKVCGWNFVPIFDNVTGFVYIILKKSRYEELIREKNSKKKGTKFYHYVYANAKIINTDIEPEYEQLSFIETSNNQKLIVKVNNMLNDIHVPFDMVNRFALILFEASNYELTSISCCIPDREFVIKHEYPWNDYVTYQDSIITEVIDEDDIKEDESRVKTPSLVGLTVKGREKGGQENITKTKHEEEESSEENN